MSDALDRLVVAELFNVYADALDNRKWSDLDDVFDPEVTVNYGGAYLIKGRPKVVAMIRSFLDPCGATQHLMGNHRAHITGETGTGSVKMRVHHVGSGNRSGRANRRPQAPAGRAGLDRAASVNISRYGSGLQLILNRNGAAKSL